jgi:esterase/lipase/1-acyl-sn-glycerol-3-phosphate acyltransferase
MNTFAYRTTKLAIKTLSKISRAKIKIYGKENIPKGSSIFVINHFTRIETLFLPYHIYHLTGRVPVWSLADYTLFKGQLGRFLESVGAVSNKNPNRDLQIVRNLLTGEASWIIYPEGRMVKSKKIIEKGRFMISYAGGKRPPHTGAAALALRTEFYRQRIKYLYENLPEEAARLLERFRIAGIAPVLKASTNIVPVNITYYPIRAKENAVSHLAGKLIEEIPERVIEEIMTEGTMLLSGVDIDIRFGAPVQITDCLGCRAIKKDIQSEGHIDFDDPLPSVRFMRKEVFKIMQQYMSEIYGMTTVNHDHLFASMLKLFPGKHIDEHALRRKVFFAIQSGLSDTGVSLHKSLKSDQFHLLTDDRFHKFKDFLAIAMEKGFVKKQGKTLQKDPSRFSPFPDFHMARIDHPIAVMANEIEPLKGLQRRLKRIALQPDVWIRRKIAKKLIREAEIAFEEEYQNFFKAGESKPKDVGMPFIVRGKTRRLGILLIHGYMAAPMEVKELARYLGRIGFWVYVPRLKGHGTSPEDLAVRSYSDWMDSVEKGYGVISSICRRTVVGGFSTGAGIALNLAADVEGVSGVFAVSAPMRLQDFAARFAPAVDVWNRLMEKIRLNGAKREFVENQPENPHINYSRNPISGVREIERLMDAVEPKLASISVPALVAQANGDPVVNPKGSKRIFDLLGSENKKYVLFNFDRHGILLGDGAEQVHRVVGNFVRSL